MLRPFFQCQSRQLRRRRKQSDFLLYTCTHWQHSMYFRVHHACECSHPRGMCPPRTAQHPTTYIKWYSDYILVNAVIPRLCLQRECRYNTMSVYFYI
jgi:hypothetical protein